MKVSETAKEEEGKCINSMEIGDTQVVMVIDVMINMTMTLLTRIFDYFNMPCKTKEHPEKRMFF